MLFVHLVVIILIILAFCCVIQYFGNLYIYTKLKNQGADMRTSKIIAENISIFIAFFFGILTFIFIVIAIQTFSGGVVI